MIIDDIDDWGGYHKIYFILLRDYSYNNMMPSSLSWVCKEMEKVLLGHV